MSDTIFEAEIEDVYRYRLSFGGQSPYFHGLQNSKLIGSCCKSCNFVWVPPRPICSRCYLDAELVELSGKARILTTILLPAAPDHLRHIVGDVATALVLPDGAHTCIKAFVIGPRARLQKDSIVTARFLPTINDIGDFYFVPEES